MQAENGVSNTYKSIGGGACITEPGAFFVLWQAYKTRLIFLMKRAI